jgi:hypothetical protein
MTAVLAAGLAAFLAFTYFTLARRSETVVRDRFNHASRLVASDIAIAPARSPRIVDFLKFAGTHPSRRRRQRAGRLARRRRA